MEWNLTLTSIDGTTYPITFEQLEMWKDSSIPVEDVVPRKQAEAVYLKTT